MWPYDVVSWQRRSTANTVYCLLLPIDERRRRCSIGSRRTVRTKMTPEPEFWRADSATDMTARTGCWSTCDRVSTSATSFGLLVVVDKAVRPSSHISFQASLILRCSCLVVLQVSDPYNSTDFTLELKIFSLVCLEMILRLPCSS